MGLRNLFVHMHGGGVYKCMIGNRGSQGRGKKIKFLAYGIFTGSS